MTHTHTSHPHNLSSIPHTPTHTHTHILTLTLGDPLIPPLSFPGVTQVLCDVIPLRIIPPAIFACIVYWMIGLPPGTPPSPWFMFLLVLNNLAAPGPCLAIGASSTHTHTHARAHTHTHT